MGRHVFTSSRGKGLDNRAAASLAGADAGWRSGDVIAATFSQINIVNIITAPRCTSSPHNSIVHSSRRNFGTIKIAVPSNIPSFANQTSLLSAIQVSQFQAPTPNVMNINVKIGED